MLVSVFSVFATLLATALTAPQSSSGGDGYVYRPPSEVDYALTPEEAQLNEQTLIPDAQTPIVFPDASAPEESPSAAVASDDHENRAGEDDHDHDDPHHLSEEGTDHHHSHDNHHHHHHDHHLGLEWLREAVPGEPGVDYPIYWQVPRTSFDCRSLHEGYYADVETGCQVFHVCNRRGDQTFLCPNGTVFDQQHFTCRWWFNVDCYQSQTFYGLNVNIGVVAEETNKISSVKGVGLLQEEQQVLREEIFDPLKQVRTDIQEPVQQREEIIVEEVQGILPPATVEQPSVPEISEEQEEVGFNEIPADKQNDVPPSPISEQGINTDFELGLPSATEQPFKVVPSQEETFSGPLQEEPFVVELPTGDVIQTNVEYGLQEEESEQTLAPQEADFIPVQQETDVVQQVTDVVAQQEADVVAQQEADVVAQQEADVIAQQETDVIAQQEADVVAQQEDDFSQVQHQDSLLLDELSGVSAVPQDGSEFATSVDNQQESDLVPELQPNDQALQQTETTGSASEQDITRVQETVLLPNEEQGLYSPLPESVNQIHQEDDNTPIQVDVNSFTSQQDDGFVTEQEGTLVFPQVESGTLFEQNVDDSQVVEQQEIGFASGNEFVVTQESELFPAQQPDLVLLSDEADVQNPETNSDVLTEEQNPSLGPQETVVLEEQGTDIPLTLEEISFTSANQGPEYISSQEEGVILPMQVDESVNVQPDSGFVAVHQETAFNPSQQESDFLPIQPLVDDIAPEELAVASQMNPELPIQDEVAYFNPLQPETTVISYEENIPLEETMNVNAYSQENNENSPSEVFDFSVPELDVTPIVQELPHSETTVLSGEDNTLFKEEVGVTTYPEDADNDDGQSAIFAFSVPETTLIPMIDESLHQKASRISSEENIPFEEIDVTAYSQESGYVNSQFGIDGFSESDATVPPMVLELDVLGQNEDGFLPAQDTLFVNKGNIEPLSQQQKDESVANSGVDYENNLQLTKNADNEHDHYRQDENHFDSSVEHENTDTVFQPEISESSVQPIDDSIVLQSLPSQTPDDDGSQTEQQTESILLLKETDFVIQAQNGEPLNVIQENLIPQTVDDSVNQARLDFESAPQEPVYVTVQEGFQPAPAQQEGSIEFLQEVIPVQPAGENIPTQRDPVELPVQEDAFQSDFGIVKENTGEFLTVGLPASGEGAVDVPELIPEVLPETETTFGIPSAAAPEISVLYGVPLVHSPHSVEVNTPLEVQSPTEISQELAREDGFVVPGIVDITENENSEAFVNSQTNFPIPASQNIENEITPVQFQNEPQTITPSVDQLNDIHIPSEILHEDFENTELEHSDFATEPSLIPVNFPAVVFKEEPITNKDTFLNTDDDLEAFDFTTTIPFLREDSPLVSFQGDEVFLDKSENIARNEDTDQDTSVTGVTLFNDIEDDVATEYPSVDLVSNDYSLNTDVPHQTQEKSVPLEVTKEIEDSATETPEENLRELHLTTTPEENLREVHLTTTPEENLRDLHLTTTPEENLRDLHLTTTPEENLRDIHLTTTPEENLRELYLTTLPTPAEDEKKYSLFVSEIPSDISSSNNTLNVTQATGASQPTTLGSDLQEPVTQLPVIKNEIKSSKYEDPVLSLVYKDGVPSQNENEDESVVTQDNEQENITVIPRIQETEEAVTHPVISRGESYPFEDAYDTTDFPNGQDYVTFPFATLEEDTRLSDEPEEKLPVFPKRVDLDQLFGIVAQEKYEARNEIQPFAEFESPEVPLLHHNTPPQTLYEAPSLPVPSPPAEHYLPPF